jgi:hypothetical protein
LSFRPRIIDANTGKFHPLTGRRGTQVKPPSQV